MLVTRDLEGVYGMRQDRVCVCLMRTYASTITVCAKVVITDRTVTLLTPNVITAETGILRRHHNIHLPFPTSFPTSHREST